MPLFIDTIDSFFSKSDKEILDYLVGWWEIEETEETSQNATICLVGTYEKAPKRDKYDKEYGFFTNVRSPRGDILYYPYKLGQVNIYTQHRPYFQDTEFLEIDVSLSKQQLRKDKKNPFLLNLHEVKGNASLKILDRIEKEKFIKKIFNETGYTLRDAKNTSNALKRIAGDLYTETERFVFELLQNADDVPNHRKEVDVRFNLLSENLLFLHNGKPFDNDDVDSISGIGDSTKRKDAEKTGYKGIGFKSVFTDAETVLINSGGFSFSFDKHSPLYKSKNIDEIPWEIKPIWTEHYRYPREVKECKDFFEFPVSINLEVGNEKIKNYREQIQALFVDPRFILFLRHIKTIEVQGLHNDLKIQKIAKNERYELLNNDIPVNEWIIDDFEFLVTQETRDAMANDKIIPEKLKEINKSKLSFACQIKNDAIINISPENSYLFTYLPTNVNDYKFPFLVNADFLTTANRQSIHVKNIWNLYLFEQIGYLCFIWISRIAQDKKLKSSITHIIPARFNTSTEPIHQYFNKGVEKAIQEVAFLPTSNGDLCKVYDAIVDLTGLSKVIGNELFIKISAPNKQLVDNTLEDKRNLHSLGVQIFDTPELKQIFSSLTFKDVLTPELILEVLKFLQKKQHNFSNIPLVLSENSDKKLHLPSSLYFQAYQDDKDLLNFKVINFLHPIINNFAEENEQFKLWLLNLGVKTFNGTDFICQEVIGKSSNFNEDLRTDEKNIAFWRFVFKYRKSLSENELKKLVDFYVIDSTKAKCPIVSRCYLSDYYKRTDEPSTESIFQELGLLDAYFLMTDYCLDKKDIGEWRKFFNSIGIKRSENTIIFKDQLVPFIQRGNMVLENYFKVTKFVFAVFISNKDIFTGLNLSNFQVYTTDDQLKPVSTCILGEDYTEDTRLNSVLSEHILPNQIHNIYLKISNNRQIWREFFLRLNPKVELDSIGITKRKISMIANKSQEITLENVLSIWKIILNFKDELIKTHKEELKKIPLLLKNETLAVSAICYFPEEYTPKTNTEKLLTGYYDYFISPKFSDISGLSYEDLKSFFKQIDVAEEIRRVHFNNSYPLSFNVKHIENLKEINFSKEFWTYFQKHINLFIINSSSSFKNFVCSTPTIPSLDGTLQLPSNIYSYQLKDLVNDRSITCCIKFDEKIEAFLGIHKKLTIPKCFQILNNIASEDNSDDKRIIKIYDDLLYHFTHENISSYSIDITEFKQIGKLLSSKDTFQNVSSLFYQDISANYLPLDDTDQIVKRFGSKEYWKQFEVVLEELGLQKITVVDFLLDSQCLKINGDQLTTTLNNSLPELAKKIDTVNFQVEENKLANKLLDLQIYYIQNLRLSCSKLGYSPTVPNYYDTDQNIIYYSGDSSSDWNRISNARLIEYLFKALDIVESQISKDEFISILLKNIPTIVSGQSYEVISVTSFELDEEENRITGRFGEEFVYQDLVTKFGKDRVIWLNEVTESFEHYDFKILNKSNREIDYYIDAKATTSGEIVGDKVPIYITVREWEFMQGQDNYVVARVYSARSAIAYVKYLKLGIQNFCT